MLKGKFKNCFGLEEFELEEIDFTNCNKTIIYAPNGVMKTSLANTFENISNGNYPIDRIFRNVPSEFDVTYCSDTSTHHNCTKIDNIFVVHSFLESQSMSDEAKSLLLADQKTKEKYEQIQKMFSVEIDEILNKLKTASGLKSATKTKMFEDFNLSEKHEWTDLFKILIDEMKQYVDVEFFQGVEYEVIFNSNTEQLYENEEFLKLINDYVENLNKLIENNDVLSTEFNDYNARELGKSFGKHDLFKANHSITLKSGIKVNSVDEWNEIVKSELVKIHEDKDLRVSLDTLGSTLTKNEKVRALRDLIINKKEIIPYLTNSNEFKKMLWLHYLLSLDNDFSHYSKKIIQCSEDIEKLYKIASTQSKEWETIIEEFNRRFNVPFKIEIENKAGYALKGEELGIVFTYIKNEGTANEEKERMGQQDLFKVLSMGERRAMYLLHVLFEIERIKVLASKGMKKYLIIVDDIADSFDYKNKYAIIEYL